MFIDGRKRDVTKGSGRQVNVFLLKVFQRDSQLELKIIMSRQAEVGGSGHRLVDGRDVGDSRFGRLHLVDLPLELVPCWRSS
jgi:hypothetical protein